MVRRDEEREWDRGGDGGQVKLKKSGERGRKMGRGKGGRRERERATGLNLNKSFSITWVKFQYLQNHFSTFVLWHGKILFTNLAV